MKRNLTCTDSVNFIIGQGGSLDFNDFSLITGMGATTKADGTAAPQVTISDSNSNITFQARALGGQLRYDKKINDNGEIYGEYSETGSKEKAIDYIDMRLAYSFDVPKNIDPDSLTWSWSVMYRDSDNNTSTSTVTGKYYSKTEGTYSDTYKSNVVLTNVSLEDYYSLEVCTWLTVSYKINGKAYTFVQAQLCPLMRTPTELITSYTESEFDTSSNAWKYISAVQDYFL